MISNKKIKPINIEIKSLLDNTGAMTEADARESKPVELSLKYQFFLLLLLSGQFLKRTSFL